MNHSTITPTQSNSSFEPVLTFEQIKDSEGHFNEMSALRRIALVVLSKTQVELTELAQNKADDVLDMLEHLAIYSQHLADMTKCTESARARLLTVMAEVHGLDGDTQTGGDA